jgi:CRISPR-associated protein Csb2
MLITCDMNSAKIETVLDTARRLAGAFRLTFRQPVRGPIALGYSSHFGLGLFLPEDAMESG